MSTPETTDTAGPSPDGVPAPEAPGGLPAPDPALRRLDPLVGTWQGRGRYLGSDEDDIVGTITFSWLPGGFFLRQDIDLDLAGQTRIRSHELIGYDAETGGFSSHVYTNMSPVPLPYRWDVQGDQVTISVTFGPLDATFRGELSEDGRTFSGGWRPNPGADETINAAYDMTGTRID
jgi:hypothetical protein